MISNGIDQYVINGNGNLSFRHALLRSRKPNVARYLNIVFSLKLYWLAKLDV